MVVFAIFAGRQLGESLENGLRSTSLRTGADIIVAPKNYISEVENALFTGEPCTAYFSQSWLDKIQNIEGVAKVSPQIFLATLSYASCCDSAVQMIAIDTNTDFTVAPWLKESVDGDLTENLQPYDIIVGSNLKYQVGDEAKFSGQKFHVTGKLSETGMGYDKSVFMSIDTARKLTHTDVVKNYFALKEGSNQISTINIRVKEGYKKEAVADNIKKAKTEGIQVLTSDNLVSGVKNSVEKYQYFFRLAGVLLYLIGGLSVTAVFSLNIQSRRKEFGILYSLGAGKRILMLQIVKEAVVLSIGGTMFGTAAGYVIVTAYGNYLKSRFELPFLKPGLLENAQSVGICFLIMLISSLIASIAAYAILALNEPDKLLREG